ncbi:MAG: chaperone modulator CbpM [Pseudomonadota bacterium]
MKALSEVVVAFGLEADELVLWVERKWVLPLAADGEPLFSAADLARVGMIVELKRELGINDEAMPVVLGLLDQIYGLRRQVRQLIATLGELPEAQRRSLAARLRRDLGPERE